MKTNSFKLNAGIGFISRKDTKLSKSVINTFTNSIIYEKQLNAFLSYILNILLLFLSCINDIL